MGKRIENAKKLIDKSKNYSLDEAISFFLKDYSEKHSAKFDETIEFIMKLGVDAKQSDQMVRGAVAMPHGLGKEKKVVVIIESSRIKEAQSSGAEEVGSEDLIEKIKGGFFDFDVCVSTPGMMPKVSAIGKLLGPKGLMPNPKLGTVSDDIKSTVQNIKKGQVEFRVDKSGIIHAGIAKLGFEQKKIKENIMELYGAVLSAKPAKSKGMYMKDLFLSTTHGPSIKLDLKSFVV
jgi:large subunit ribosomal protein L1